MVERTDEKLSQQRTSIGYEAILLPNFSAEMYRVFSEYIQLSGPDRAYLWAITTTSYESASGGMWSSFPCQLCLLLHGSRIVVET